MSKFSVMQDIRLPKIPVGYPLKRNRTGETSNQPERLDREEVVFVPLWGLSHCSTRSVCHDGAAWAVLSARIRCRKEAVTALSLGLLASCWALHNSRYGVPSRTESKGSTPRSGAKPADIWTQGRKGNRGGRTVGSAITSWSPLASGLKASWRNRRALEPPPRCFSYILESRLIAIDCIGDGGIGAHFRDGWLPGSYRFQGIQSHQVKRRQLPSCYCQEALLLPHGMVAAFPG